MQFKQFIADLPHLIDVQYLLSHDTSKAKLVAKKVVTSRNINRKIYATTTQI